MDDRPRPGTGGFAPGMGGRVEEVAAGLKLDAAQKERLRNREAFRSVLTAEQSARWEELLGEPFAGNVFPTRPGSSAYPRRAAPRPSRRRCSTSVRADHFRPAHPDS